jgi:glutaredoxin-like protein NrdH
MVVKVYSRPDCQPCRLTKMRFDKLGIPFTEVDLDDTALAYTRSLGYTSAPVIEVDYGEGVTTSWAGLRPDYIAALAETLTPPG